MSIKTEVGRVVWHDLLTGDVAKARCFYAELLGWEYQIEHASDFVWKPGQADYPLILANGAAHGGFVASEAIPSHWISYVTVEDVDRVTAKAKTLGAMVDREPFDVPGVGRTAVIRDPRGAIICPYVSSHRFPPPGGLFLWDELLTDDIDSAKTFYGELFGWEAKDLDRGRKGSYTVFRRDGGTDAAGATKQPLGTAGPAAWIPYLVADDVAETASKARTLGAGIRKEGTDMVGGGRFAILADPTGAVFGLIGVRPRPAEV